MSHKIKSPYLLTPHPSGVEIVIDGAIFHKDMDAIQLVTLARRLLDAAAERLMLDARKGEAQ